MTLYNTNIPRSGPTLVCFGTLGGEHAGVRDEFPRDDARVETLKPNIARREYTVAVIGSDTSGCRWRCAWARPGSAWSGSTSTPPRSSASTPARATSGRSAPPAWPRWWRRGVCTTADFDGLGKADAIVICVPTPLTRQRDPDLQSGFPIWTDCRSHDGVHGAARVARPVRQLVNTSQHVTGSHLGDRGDCGPPFPGFVTPTVAFRDTPAGSPLTRHRLHSAGLAVTLGATRAARCAGESAERGSPSSNFRRVAG